MNILVIGSGAREHAIIKKLSVSYHEPNLFCYGTSYNPGIMEHTDTYWCGKLTETKEIVAKALAAKIELAIIGPEAPLEAGLADALWDVNIKTIGPKRELAQIETSKVFARNLMLEHDIPGLPEFKEFQNENGILEYLKTLDGRGFVVKANGLMSGKGVKIFGEHLDSHDDALQFCREVFAMNQSVVIEEKLNGQEFSLMCFTDGMTMVPMPLVQDHKRAYVDDKGPNTGGMGSYSAANHGLPFLNEDEIESAMEINQSVLDHLQAAFQDKYIGILYGSFIATGDGVKVIEFNARFGDPEALNILTILETDLLAIFFTMVESDLSKINIQFKKQATVCKYLVPEGYPQKSVKNVLLDLSNVTERDNLFLASVNHREGKLYTEGSRTVAYVGVGLDTGEAEQEAESVLSSIKGPFYYRNDIGKSDLISKRIRAMQALRVAHS